MKVSKKSIFVLGIILLSCKSYAGMVDSEQKKQSWREFFESEAEEKLADEKIIEEERREAPRAGFSFEPEVEPPMYVMPGMEQRLGARLGQSQAEVLNEIMMANETLFSNWATKKFDMRYWISALQDLETYVNENSPRNTVLKNAANKIREIGVDLPQKIRFGNNLLQVRDKLQSIKDKIKAEYLWGWGSEKREEVRNVLEEVIELLMMNINNAPALSNAVWPK